MSWLDSVPADPASRIRSHYGSGPDDNGAWEDLFPGRKLVSGNHFRQNPAEMFRCRTWREPDIITIDQLINIRAVSDYFNMKPHPWSCERRQAT
jgi:hypothetical protein